METLITSERIHTALNHIPLIGLMISLVPLVTGLILRDRRMLITALVMCIFCSGFVLVVMMTGDAAKGHFLGRLSELNLVDSSTREFVEAHEKRADLFGNFVFGEMIAAMAALAVVLTKPKRQFFAGWIVVLTTLAALAALIWVADSGGKIRHPEFRPSVSSVEPITDLHAPGSTRRGRLTVL